MISKWISSRRRSLRLGDSEAVSIVSVAVGLALLGAILVGLERYRGDKLQDLRNNEQAHLLETMESLHNTAVSDVVTNWRLAYPEPNDERLAELRDLARQVETDPSPLLGAPAAMAGSTELASHNDTVAGGAVQPDSLQARAGKQGP